MDLKQNLSSYTYHKSFTIISYLSKYKSIYYMIIIKLKKYYKSLKWLEVLAQPLLDTDGHQNDLLSTTDATLLDLKIFLKTKECEYKNTQ